MRPDPPTVGHGQGKSGSPGGHTLTRLGRSLIVALVIGGGPAAAAEPPGAAVGSSLPPNIRALLVQEMNAVLWATREILGGLVQGQDDLVARKAQAIHDSFILKKELTEADRKALVAAVPAAFLERDRAFHELSARLAEAARAGDRPRQRALFADMIEACTGCHSRHARDRFPEF